MLTLTESGIGAGSGFYGISLPFTGTSDPVYFQSGFNSISVAISPAVGQTARVEYTLSLPNEVMAGTAVWLTWPLGNVSAPADDAMLTKAYAVRGVSSGGTAKLEVLAT